MAATEKKEEKAEGKEAGREREPFACSPRSSPAHARCRRLWFQDENDSIPSLLSWVIAPQPHRGSFES